MKFHIIAIATIALSLNSCSPSKEKNFNRQADAVACYDMSMPPPPESNERYAQIAENSFKSVATDPLSTFAVDVDGASYTNVRRMLMDGNLPPADAVRAEEFINYFTYTYPAPTDQQPFSVYTEYSKCPWANEHYLLQIGLKGKEIQSSQRPDNNLVFLVDVSGSMQSDDKLPLLKRAFKLLVNQLKPEDKVSLVVYAGSAGVVLDGADGDDPEKIMQALDELEAGGSTAGGEGIELAFKVALDHYIKKGNNRVILATDGDFNVGISSVPELEKFIGAKRNDGIYLSVLGFGQGNIKDDTMELLADKGNGNYYYIDNFMEARKVLVSQFGGTLITIAKDVKLQVEFNPAYVKEYRLIGYENRLLNAEDFNDDKKDAGEIGAGHTVTALYEIVPAGTVKNMTNIDPLKYRQTANAYENDLATVKCRYKGPAKNDTTSLSLSHPVVLHQANKEPSANIRLAAGAAEFALLLRDSQFKQDASFDNALELAESAMVNDKDTYVAGLTELIKIAKDLQPAARK